MGHIYLQRRKFKKISIYLLLEVNIFVHSLHMPLFVVKYDINVSFRLREN